MTAVKRRACQKGMPGLGWGILNCFYSLDLKRIPVPVKEAWPEWDGFTSFLLLTCLLLRMKSFWVRRVHISAFTGLK